MLKSRNIFHVEVQNVVENIVAAFENGNFLV
jgi:hypothetical protein